MCVFEPTTRFIESVVLSFKRDLSNYLKRFRKKRFAEFGERDAEFNFDSKILFNLWGWLWLPMGCSMGERYDNSTKDNQKQDGPFEVSGDFG